MRQSVDRAVRWFLASKSLPEARFARLNEIAGQTAPADAAHDGDARRVAVPYWGIAAAVVAVAAFAWSVAQHRVPMPSVEVHQHIADEVATNHVKLKPLEVSADDMSEVREFFGPLGFELVESSLFEETPWRMMGGRFCTIRGEAAAQLRMRGPHGRVQTVYQVSYDSDSHRSMPDVMRGEVPIKLYSHGLEVRLWRERGLLFAAAVSQ